MLIYVFYFYNKNKKIVKTLKINSIISLFKKFTKFKESTTILLLQ